MIFPFIIFAFCIHGYNQYSNQTYNYGDSSTGNYSNQTYNYGDQTYNYGDQTYNYGDSSTGNYSNQTYNYGDSSTGNYSNQTYNYGDSSTGNYSNQTYNYGDSSTGNYSNQTYNYGDSSTGNYSNQTYNSDNSSANGSYYYGNQTYDSGGLSKNQSYTQTNNTISQCVNSFEAVCKTKYSMYFVFVLDFVFEQFDSSKYDAFMEDILNLAGFSSDWSTQLKLKYVQIHRQLRGSVYINGTIYFLSQSLLNTAKLRFRSFSSSSEPIGGLRVQSMGFIQTTPAVNEQFYGSNVSIFSQIFCQSTGYYYIFNGYYSITCKCPYYGYYYNGYNQNYDCYCSSGYQFQIINGTFSCIQITSSNSMMIIIGTSVGGGVTLIVVGMIIYFCCKNKKTSDNKNDSSKNQSDSAEQIIDKDGQESSEIIKTRDIRKSMDYFGQNLDFD